MENTPGPAIYIPREGEAFFRNRHNVTVAFAVAILLFLLPFAEIRCMNNTLAKNTGLGIAIGSQWKSDMMGGLKDMMDSMPGKEDSKKDFGKQMKDTPNGFAIAALVAGVIGLVVGLLQVKSRSLIVMCAGILGVIMLVALMIQMKIQLRSQMGAGKKGGDFSSSGAMDYVLSVKFTIWYYISLISFAVGGFFGYKHHRIELVDALRSSHAFDFQKEQPEHPKPADS
ncbi:MAG: hypothetical protein NTW29_04855 [Bacteroidetes bacterium]|nr:hypothetical protein [Bacteroidota bacterium]